MKAGAVLRIARSTDHLAAIAEMYATGLDFIVLAQFEAHDGFDGIILGHPQQPYHLEFTTHRGHQVGKAPTHDSNSREQPCTLSLRYQWNDQ